MSKSSGKPKPDNRSTIIKGSFKPNIPNFPGQKTNPDFRPTGRFQSINRSRR